MNPLYNPYYLIRLLKIYIGDVNRLWKLNNESLKEFQDKAVREVVEYANDVPLYNKKYKEAGIHPKDIKSIGDLHKHPFTTRKDIQSNYPEGIVPPNFDKKNAIMSCTSGTTDISVSIIGGRYDALGWVLGSLREMKVHNINWRKTKVSIITDLSEHSVVRGYYFDGMIPYLKPFFSLDNIQVYDCYCDPKETLDKMNSFQPEVISGFPGILKKFAVLRRRGFGKDIQPRCMTTVGQVLDKYTKKDIEKTFQTQIFDSYGTTEGGPIAFQCSKGGYHIHSDLVYPEIIDDNDNPVPHGDAGRIVVTKLYADGTPIIRYTGIDDIISLNDKSCDCGLAGGMIQEIHGRETQSIVLPGDRLVLPSTIANFYGGISQQVDTDKIEGFQLIQHSMDKIEINVLIDKDMKTSPPPNDKIFQTIKNNFQDTFGPNLNVIVKEKKKFEQHSPSVISKVDKTKIKKKIYV